MLKRSSRFVFVVLVLVVAGLVNAQRAITQSWMDELDKSSNALKDGDHAQSLRITDRLLREMVDQLGPGDAAMQLFGTVLSHKALALAGLGKKDDALWYWHTLLTLYPAFSKSDVSMFGDAGKFLEANRDPRKPMTAPPKSEWKPLPPEFRPPTLLKRVAPEFPKGAHHFGVEGRLVVSVVISRDGTVTAPVVRSPLPAPTLSYAALEALRKWRFIPATRNGQPIEAQYDLTVNFKL